jgi:choline dehydrogenase
VLFDGARAVGVEYLRGEHLYRADPRADQAVTAPEPRRLRVKKEVILSAGAFNSPQLLKLSGIGPRDELTRLGIPVLVDLPGVGQNLQDRYEVGVVTEVKSDFPILHGCSFAPPSPGEQPDPCLVEWQAGQGVYTTNGVVSGIIKRSQTDRPLPDLFIFGLPGCFQGYYPKYSAEIEAKRNYFTWAILKAHTNNSAGTVTLRSADPRDVPEINFHYFDEGNDAGAADLESVVDGLEFVRRLVARASRVTLQEKIPGEEVRSRDDLRQFVKDEAWGHHASCTCKMGPGEDRLAVVDSAFRVHGTIGLRVVDASIFPRIPGFFIVTPIYMVSEKASDVILADARH